LSPRQKNALNIKMDQGGWTKKSEISRKRKIVEVNNSRHVKKLSCAKN
jgi:hypothetical protein